MKIISIVNQKGGVGKTTSAISLSGFLGKTKRVLLIDLDPQGNATSNAGIDKRQLKKTVKDLLLEDNIKAQECIVETSKGFDIVGSNLDVANTEINMIGKFNREYILKSKIEKLDYDYVIIDCSPSLSIMTLNALVCSNIALTPLEAHMFAVEGIESLMTTIEIVRQVNSQIEHKFFITKFDRRIKQFEEIEKNLRNSLEDNMLRTKIRVDNAIRNAQNEIKTIWEIKNCKSANDYEELVNEVLNG